MEGGKLGGVPVQLVVEDDGLKPGQGKQIADKFMKTDKIKLFTGIVFSNVAGAVVPDVLDGGGIYVSPNAGPSNFAGKECHKNYFVVSWQNDTLHESAGQNATNLGYKKAFILAPNYQAGQGRARRASSASSRARSSARSTRKLDQTDFAAEMAQIRAAKPDVVFQFHPGGLGIAFMRQYRRRVSRRRADGGRLAVDGRRRSLAGGRRCRARRQPDGALEHGFRQSRRTRSSSTRSRRNTTACRPIMPSQGYDTALAIGAALKGIRRQGRRTPRRSARPC